MQQQPLAVQCTAPSWEAAYCTVQLYIGCTVQRPGAGFVSFRDTEAESDSERMGLGSADKGEAAVQTVQACTVQYKDLHYHLSCQTD